MNQLIIALLYKETSVYEQCLKELKHVFGPFTLVCKEYPFTFSDFYADEMGTDLKKRLVVFKKFIDSKGLKQTKIQTASLEQKFMVDGKRTVNIDPGMMSKKVFYLASFKKKYFKIDLGGGIYMHKLFEFRDGKIIENETTFGDYKQGLVHDFLQRVMYKMK